MKTKQLGIIILLGLFIVNCQADINDNATMREIPSTRISNNIEPTVNLHPEYKKLMDDLRRIQKKLET